MALPASSPEPDRVAGLYPATVNRLGELAGARYQRVVDLNRRVEDATNCANEPGATIQLQILGQVSNLLSRAESLSLGEQQEYVGTVEQLIRSMGESWSAMLQVRIGEVSELWDRYAEVAKRLHESEELSGCPSHRELERIWSSCLNSFDAGRMAIQSRTWENCWMGAEQLISAAETATQAVEGVEQAISAAKQHERERKRHRGHRRLMIAAIVASAAVTVGVHLFLPPDAGGPSRTVTVRTSPPPQP
jgi:hypothetical protein